MIEDELRETMAAAGIRTAAPLVLDGKLRRVSVEGDAPNTRNGWYVGFADDPAAAAFGCWKRQVEGRWCSRDAKTLSDAERRALAARMAEAQEAREREEYDRRQRAAAESERRWSAARPADPAHPYLQRKQVSPHDLRQDGDELLVPMFGDGDALCGLQRIFPDGSKRFLPGSCKRGAFHMLGKPNGVVGIAEGYATAASVREATGLAVAVAFDAGNLRPVAERLRRRHPDSQIVFAADSDHHLEENVGLVRAQEAAHSVGGVVIVPEFDSTEDGSDWNDVATTRGIHAVAEAFAEVAGHNDAPPEAEAAEPLFRPADIRFGRFLDAEPPPRRMILEDVLPFGVAGLLAAMGGAGKTRLLYQLLFCIAAGLPEWMGVRLLESGSVLGLFGEDDDSELHRVGWSLIRHYDPNPAAREAVAERLHIMSRVAANNLLTSADRDGEVRKTRLVEQVIDAASRIPDLKVIVLEPVSRWRGGKANNEEDATRFVEALEAIREGTGATVLTAAHVSKSGISEGGGQEIVRGSSALVDGVRWVSTLQRLRKDAAADYGIREDEADRYLRFDIPKSNYAPPFPGLWLRREAGGVLVPAELQPTRVVKAEQRKQTQYLEVVGKIQEVIRAAGPQSVNQLETKYAGELGPLGVGQKAVRAICERAKLNGDLVQRPGHGGSVVLHVPGGDE